MEPRYTDRPRQWRGHSGVIPGFILVGIGALFLLNNLHIFYFQDWWRYWPAILIAGGIVKLVDSTLPGGRIFGGVLVAIGGLFLAHTLGFLYIRPGDLWPLILIGLGVMLLFQRTMNWPSMQGGRAASSGVLHAFAVFGGGKRKIAEFQGGEVSAVFGGYEIDLRKATMAGDSAVLEINAVFGGAEVRIPENWIAMVEGVGVFGGFSDETVHPVETPGVKRVILRGSAIFGGVVVKN
jgi:hypothetical protein